MYATDRRQTKASQITNYKHNTLCTLHATTECDTYCLFVTSCAHDNYRKKWRTYLDEWYTRSQR